MLANKKSDLKNNLSLQDELFNLSTSQPEAWQKLGANSRPNVHGLLRYPAMMVPTMQSNILDCILKHAPENSYIFDPFVGSGQF
ncbi:hypothetical protein QJS67_04075 [Acinetobacter radioresistens]|nr:hypothetical protein QJS67_04075 [Acinetobacter radioresistens]